MLHRDFVPWRFSNAGRISARLAHQRRRPKTLYGAIIVKVDLRPVSISLFDQRTIISSSRSGFPWPPRTVAVKGGRMAIAKRLALDGHEHGSRLPRLSECTDDDNSEGSSRLGAETAPQPCIRSIGEDRNHDAVIRIGGEAPGRRAQSAQRLGGRGFYDGSPPPRIVIGRPNIGCQTGYPVAPQLPLILMLVVTRRPVAPLLW
jgi:hypothetical protein